MAGAVTAIRPAMDNLAHTLLGLSLSKAGLDRSTPLATAALVISSNLPDIDVISRLVGGSLAYLKYHRGITHSFAGLVLLSGLLTLVLWSIDRRIRLKREPSLPPARPLTLFVLSYAGGLGHVFMDYTNSYGVRPLLPFSDVWWYGDLAFVIDPWIWLILGSSSVWLTKSKRLRMIAWIPVAILTSAPLIAISRVPSPGDVSVSPLAKWIWFGGLAVIVVGLLKRWELAGAKLAAISLALLWCYYSGLLVCRHYASAKLNSTPGEATRSIAVWPIPATPFLWQGITSSSHEIRSGVIELWRPIRTDHWRRADAVSPEIESAIGRSEPVSEFLRFARFKSASVESSSDGYFVRLRDLRFNLEARVYLDPDLNVKSSQISWF